MVVEPNVSLQRVQLNYIRILAVFFIDMARIDIGQSHYAHLRRGTSKSLLSGLKLKKDALI